MSKVKIVRLKSGEELVAKVEFGAQLIISKPCIILPTGDNGNIGLYKFLPYAKADSIEISREDTYFIVDPQEDLENYYLDITKEESSIITPPANEIIV